LLCIQKIVQKYEEEGAKLDPDLLEAMDSKKAHEVFFEFVFPELKGVAARMDKYYEDPRAEYYTTVRDRHIKFHDPTAEDPDWKIKNNILLILAAANESATGVDGLWKSGQSHLYRKEELTLGGTVVRMNSRPLQLPFPTCFVRSPFGT
jgi:hypothetical protein